MKKKLFARALALVMSLSLLSTSALAHVVTIEGVEGTQDVETVQAGVDAIANSESKSGSIQLTDTAEENVTITGANVTIDLNGNSIWGDGNNSVIKVTGGDTSLELTDTSDAGTGSITGGGGKAGGGIYVDDHANVTMTGGTITGNNVTENGGGVYIKDGSSFTMSGDANINRNGAGHSGGGVFVNNGHASWDHSNFTMEDGTIAENTAGNGSTAAGGGIGAYGHQDASRDEDAVTIRGGEIKDNRLNYTGSDGAGIAVSNGAITMTGGTVSGNTGANQGGGIYIYDSNANISNTTIGGSNATDRNNAKNGGGIFVAGDKSDVTVTNSTISGNAASNYGGGIYSYGSVNVSVSGGSITGNTASNYGGGIHAQQGATVTMGGTTIEGNTAKFGGGVFNWTGTVTMNGGEIKGNTGTGAGVYNMTNATFNMNGGSISNNIGNGVYNYYNSTFNMESGTISGNQSTNGSGVYNNNATFNMKGGSITGNHASNSTATGGGGGVFNCKNATFTMSGGEISGNTTAGQGGGLFNYTATFTMTGGQLYGNSAAGSADDIYSNTQISLITAEDMGASISGEAISRWLWDTSTSRYKDGNYSICSVDGETELRLKAAPAQLFTVTVNNGYSEEPILNTTLDRNSKFPTIADPEREGYRFDGWGIELPELVEGNIELTARWTHVDHATATRVENEVPAQIGVAGSYEVVTYCTVCGEVLNRVTETTPALEPDEPEVPDTPDIPDQPDTPDTPDTPENPGDVIIPAPDVPLGGAPETETTIEDEAVPLAGIVTLAEMLEEMRQREQVEDAELPEDFKFIDHDYAQAIFWALAEGLIVDTEEEPLDPDEIVTVGLLQKVLDNFVANYKEFEDFTMTVEGEADELVMDLSERLAAFYAELDVYEAANK